MKRPSAIVFALLAFGFGGSWLKAQGQKAVVIHAGQLFDGKSDRLSSNQVIVIQGDRIAEVGPAATVKIPAGAQEIDLGMGTVLPGLIEGHNHMFKVEDHPGAGPFASVPLVIEPGTPFSAAYTTLLAAVNARLDLLSGFTTARDLSSGGTADVDLRNAINEGLVPGPRMRVATEGMRGSIAGARYFHLVDSPWEGRQQVRIQLKNGADFIKIYAAEINGAPTMTPASESGDETIGFSLQPNANAASTSSIGSVGNTATVETITPGSPESLPQTPATTQDATPAASDPSPATTDPAQPASTTTPAPPADTSQESTSKKKSKLRKIIPF